MVVGTLNELPESRRLLIRNATQRINDITNDLSKREKSAPLSVALASASVEIEKRAADGRFAYRPLS